MTERGLSALYLSLSDQPCLGPPGYLKAFVSTCMRRELEDIRLRGGVSLLLLCSSCPELGAAFA